MNSEVQIDKSKSVAERIEDYISQTGNPYCFVCGKTPVEIRFASENSPSLDKIIVDFFIRKKPRKQAEF